MIDLTGKEIIFRKWIMVSLIALGIWMSLFFSSTLEHCLFLYFTIIACICVLPILRRIYKNKFDPFEPIFIIMFIIFMGFFTRPIYNFFFEDMVLINPLYVSREEMIRIYLTVTTLVIAGTGVFLIGYNLKSAINIGKSLPIISGNWSDFRTRRVVKLFSALGVMGYLATFAFTKRFVFFSHMEGMSLFFHVVNLFVFANLIILCHQKRFTKNYILHCVFTFLLLFSYFSRGRLAMFIIAIAVIYHYLIKRLSLKSFAYVMIPIVFLLIMLPNIRYFARFYDDPVVMARAVPFLTEYFSDPVNIVNELFSGDEFSFFDFFSMELEYVPDDLDFSPFYNVIVNTTFFVHSSLWPDKPLTFGRVLAGKFAKILPPSPAFSIFGDLYFSFTGIGLIVGMFFFGVMCRILYQYLVEAPDNKSVILIYAVVFSMIFWFVKVGISDCLELFIGRVLPVLLAAMYMSNFKLLHKSPRLKNKGPKTISIEQ